MNSILTIELNTILTEYIQDHPITGRSTLDARIVTVAVSLITVYTAVVTGWITGKIYKWYVLYWHNRSKDKYFHFMFDKKMMNSTHPTSIRHYFNHHGKKENLATKNMKNAFTINLDNSNPDKQWKYTSGGVLLPTSTYENELVDQNDVSNSVDFEDWTIVYKAHEYESGLYYHFYLSTEKNTNEDPKKLFDKFFKHVNKVYDKYCEEESKKNGKYISLFEIRDKEWVHTLDIKARSLDTIVGDTCRSIVKDITNFEENFVDIYKSLDIPYKRGYLLYGPPGTGKTSIIKAVAGCTNRSIFKVTFNEKGLGDEEYQTLFNRITRKCIILLDDIDPALLQEGGFIEKKNKEETSRVSYNTLLDCLDGINGGLGKLTFISTNHADKIGAALKRPGRIDMISQMGYATDSEIQEYFKYFYKYFELDKETIEKNALVFINNLKKMRETDKERKSRYFITFAQLQQQLLYYLKDIESCANNVDKIFEHMDIKSCV